MFQKKTKGLIAGAIASSMLMLSACSTDGNTTAGSASSSAGANNSQAAAKSSTPVTLQVWMPVNIPELDPAIKQIGTNFEKTHPNIKVEITTIPFADYFQKLSVAYAGGIQPDVHGLGFGQLISTVDQGNYMDMNPLIEKDNWSGKSDFFPDILKAGQWNGGTYGLLIPETRPLVWRKDYFQEAGLDPNKPPQTYDELFAYAKKLSKKDSSGKVTRSGLDITTSTVNNANSEQPYLSMLLLNGLNFYDDKGNPTFDSPESVKVTNQLTDLVKDKDVMFQADSNVTGTLFQNSLAAMGFQSSYSLGQLTQSIGNDKIGFALPPKGPTGKQTSLMLGTFMTIAKKSAHPQEAWEFMKFMFSPDEFFQFAKATGYVPPLQSQQAKFEGLGDANKVIFASMKDAGGFLPSSNWSIITKYLRIGLEEAYYGKKTPEQAMKDNANKARQEVSKK
ncbi:extracellular solute-binding protein [Paenibacillus sp. LMG 31456]|uniref:Extracellular solute-binding protein n=1 Tax=Paenibacillus foliorum TaxID=2654974 RepID=A0A972GN43_9BACL|nr:ABC transporter substrate-binding protein [Paenibacillus foliorum]NOU93754.1 extracellular solute-binding protein [Paenibacillus foliorum]